MIERSIYDENEDIIWPTIVGIFVALALGWMICRYKCSSKERSPHVVQCCPKSLCQSIRLCCRRVFRLESEGQQRDLRLRANSRARSSNNSLLEISSVRHNSDSSLTLPYPQWPSSFLSNDNQRASFPLITTIQSPVAFSQPKQHPLRQYSLMSMSVISLERCESPACPFPTNIDFLRQPSEVKKNYLLFSA